MPRILRINKAISGASSVAGSQLLPFAVDAVLPLDNIALLNLAVTQTLPWMAEDRGFLQRRSSGLQARASFLGRLANHGSLGRCAIA